MSKIAIQDERGFNQVFTPIGSTSVRARRRNDWFAAQVENFGAKRILELGCGTGETAAYLAKNLDIEVIAVDISNSFIEQARTRHKLPNLRFELFDLLGENDPPFNMLEMVYGNGILHHLVLALPRVLSLLHELTRPGGGLAFIEPNFLNPYCAFIFGTRIGRRWARLEPDEMAFTPGEIGSVLPTAGWKNVTVTTRDFLVPGLPEWLVKPIQLVEPSLEATTATRWLAQSHFITAYA